MAKDQLKNFLDENTNTANFVDFFGPFYRTKPDQFAFSCGDKKMLQQLSEFVKSTVRVYGYEYFQGLDRPCNANVKRHEADNSSERDSKDELFEGILNLLQPYGDSVQKGYGGCDE